MAELTLVIGNKNYSSWSLRPWLAMKQVGLDFEEVVIFLDTPTTHERIRRYSPSGKVPVLVHGDLKIWESLAICEYIAEQFAPSLWPEDAAVRAIARAICAEKHSGFHNLRQNMPMDCRSRHPGEGMKPTVKAEIDRITAIWRECRQTYGAGGDMLFGHFTIADAMYASAILRFYTYGVKLEDPVSRAYAEALWALPALQEWIEAACQESGIVDIPKF